MALRRLKVWLSKLLLEQKLILKNKFIRETFNSYIDKKEILSLNRYSVAMGVAIGFFCAFLPLPGQMMLAILLSILSKCNVIIATSITWISNPVTFIPIIYFIYWIGDLVFQLRNNVGVTELVIPMNDIQPSLSTEWIFNAGFRYLIGLPIVAFGTALLSYVIVFFAWNLGVRLNSSLERRTSRNNK